MILSEEEARKKQCRIFGPVPVNSPNVVGAAPKIGFAFCGASACCHWRWDTIADNKTGYCGIAGVPMEPPIPGPTFGRAA